MHAVNPTHSNIPPMRVLGSARIPIVFLPEDCVHNIAVRIVEGLPYGFILGARFIYANKSILNFGTDKGFKPTPASPWVPFLDRNMTASNSPSSWDHFYAFSSMIHNDHMPNTLGPTPQTRHAAGPPSLDRVAWEDDSTLQWDVRLVDDTEIKEPRPLPGFTSIIPGSRMLRDRTNAAKPATRLDSAHRKVRYGTWSTGGGSSRNPVVGPRHACSLQNSEPRKFVCQASQRSFSCTHDCRKHQRHRALL